MDQKRLKCTKTLFAQNRVSNGFYNQYPGPSRMYRTILKTLKSALNWVPLLSLTYVTSTSTCRSKFMTPE